MDPIIINNCLHINSIKTFTLDMASILFGCSTSTPPSKCWWLLARSCFRSWLLPSTYLFACSTGLSPFRGPQKGVRPGSWAAERVAAAFGPARDQSIRLAACGALGQGAFSSSVFRSWSFNFFLKKNRENQCRTFSTQPMDRTHSRSYWRIHPNGSTSHCFLYLRT
jgi:hypothetical protein